MENKIEFVCDFFNFLNDKHILIKLGKSVNLPIDFSFKISKLIKKLEDERQIFEKIKMKLINEYCDKDDAGKAIIDENNMYKFTNNSEIFTIKYNELLNQKIILDIDKIDIEINTLSNENISAIDLINLELFFNIK